MINTQENNMIYAAYGSNMNIEQMKYRCPESKIIGNGKLKGWKLVFNVYADVIKGEPDDVVPVVCWDIAENDWERLDIYEGFPDYYVKEIVDIALDDGRNEKGIVYVMTDDRKGLCLPYREYLKVCLQGYKDNGIDVQPLYEALKYTRDNR